jgi:transmembrane sensor
MAHDMDPTLSIAEQAADWWDLLHSDAASAADHREFGEWVARSPERVAAYLQTARLSNALRSDKIRWPDTSPETLIREARQSGANVLPIVPGASVTSQGGGHRRQGLRSRFALALAATLIIGIASPVWFVLTSPQQFKTKFGEERSILLDDGSRVTLNTASTIEVELGKRHRLVRLVEGEALFDVAHDAGRPFDVRAGSAVLRAVGTQFNVDLRPSQTTVTVVEGRVQVASETTRGTVAPPAGAPILGTADRLVITPAGLGTPIHGANIAAATSWTQHQLVFEHRPLIEVAAEFNRYNRDRVVIEGAELEQQEVTGVFQSNDPASFVAFLASLPGVQVREGVNGAHIVAAPGAPPAGR